VQRGTTGTTTASRPILFLLLATCLVGAALADLISAHSAYEKGDYGRAFSDFRELAELGQPTAQYDLAVMYPRGEGTRQSNIYLKMATSCASLSSRHRCCRTSRMRPFPCQL
jgi:hypothetical protein